MMLREQKMASLHKEHFFLWVLLSCLGEVSHPSPASTVHLQQGPSDAAQPSGNSHGVHLSLALWG